MCPPEATSASLKQLLIYSRKLQKQLLDMAFLNLQWFNGSVSESAMPKSAERNLSHA